MKVIGLAGKAGSGKSTAAGILSGLLSADGDVVLVMPFAAALKAYCRRFCGWDGQKDDYGRRLLQSVGSAHRKVHPGWDRKMSWLDIVSYISKSRMKCSSGGIEKEICNIDDLLDMIEGLRKMKTSEYWTLREQEEDEKGGT